MKFQGQVQSSLRKVYKIFMDLILSIAEELEKEETTNV